MKYISTIIFLFSFIFASFSQSDFAQKLYNSYENFRENSIIDRRFKHTTIDSLLKLFAQNELFKIKEQGKSIEGRSINLVSLGQGKTSVLLWSQMHGNEPTATMALMDIFNFFNTTNDFEAFKENLLNKLTLHFIPMLNPDGAEQFQRRNALQVDLNRDALRLQNPESQILKKVRDSLQADWGFNLHDQNRYNGAGLKDGPVSFAFLAPAYNYEKEINENRGDAMKLIISMNRISQDFLPGKTARYNDDFEPRAFGDNIQKWGTRTILIESGGLIGDPEKQELRKIHFALLLKTLEHIAKGDYEKEALEDYEKIPFNQGGLYHDLIIRNANFILKGKPYILDLGFRSSEKNFDNDRLYYYQSSITDIGDLHNYHAYEQWDASGFTLEEGKVYPKSFKRLKQLRKENLLQLIQQGFTTFKIKNMPKQAITMNLPIQLISHKSEYKNDISIGSNPGLIFKKEGSIKYLLINGKLIDLEKEPKVFKKLLKHTKK